ncbi:MAG: pyruvate/oxaloacetate carboxyltransferase [Chloroflexi bacterium]|nr:pyruvate/oxaloacetate carboxyltransferase [Chloroflexota bacterium]
MNGGPLRITDTTLRDAHQSLLATRLRLKDMLPVLELIDAVGYHSVEMWGGATFDAAMRFLGEDPWERARTIRAHLSHTPCQMLLRGQNLVGYRHYPDDIVERFIARAKANGIDVFRIFDALNDVRNMAWAMTVAKRVGSHVQASICYTTSPVHTLDKFVALAVELENMGADSICIKDMAGLITPYAAFELIRHLKARLHVPVQLHTHYTSGMGTSVYLKAAEVGVDVVDTAISSLALSTSQPPTEVLVSMLQGSPRDTGLDLELLAQIARYFADTRAKYHKFEGGVAGIDVRVLQYQIPGGMISNLVSQLREQNALDRYEEVLAEVPRVRAELGYPPLVTPTSQIVGTQATLNVLLGERYKIVPEEVKAYVKGFYGRPPAPIDEEVKKRILGDEQPIACRPADLLEPGYEKAAQEIGDLAQSEEDVLSYALFPHIARTFLERRARGESEEERVAAIAAAILAQREKKAAVAVPSSPPVSLWKMAGRIGRRWRF